MARPRSKSPRSILLAVRVTPRVRFALELLANRERCSMSEVVLRTIESRIAEPGTGLTLVPAGESDAVSVPDRVWSPLEHERIVRLGLYFPEFMNDRQRYLWSRVRESRMYWTRGGAPAHPTPDDVNWPALAHDWPELARAADGG